MSDFDATVAICTFNGSSRIKMVLDSLQLHDAGKYTWEVLIIDNASTDQTSEICTNLIKHLAVPSKVVKEESLGITHARRRASMEAKGRILCFLDDDNPAKPDFVLNAVKFLEGHPKCGVVGGKVEPIWEGSPTPLVLSVSEFALAICDRGNKSFKYEGPYSGPVGAGMCIRTDLLRKLYGASNLPEAIPSRTGNKLSGGEDPAFCLLAKQSGYECWYEPSIQSKHYIPKRRMEKSYLLGLFEGIGQGQAAVRRLWDWKANNPLTATLIASKDFVRWLGGAVLGPKTDSASQDRRLNEDLHELNQRLLRGRILATISIK